MSETLTYVRQCSLPFVWSPLLICLGLCILSTSLATLSVTTSYRSVFPFGAPLWTGTLFLMIGCFLVFAYKPSDKVLALSSNAHVWFTLSLAIIAACECLLALALSLWHYGIALPVFSTCTPEHPPPRLLTTACECSEGFINPPSLIRRVYRFDDVFDCTRLGSTLRVFYIITSSMYGMGALLSFVLAAAACKILHSLGVCRESGVYVVTPEPSAASRPPSPEHSSVGASHHNLISSATPGHLYHTSSGSLHQASTGSLHQASTEGLNLRPVSTARTHHVPVHRYSGGGVSAHVSNPPFNRAPGVSDRIRLASTGFTGHTAMI